MRKALAGSYWCLPLVCLAVSITGVSLVGVEHAAGGQVQVQLPQPGHIGIAPGVHGIIHRQAAHGHDNIDFYSVKPTSLAGAPAVVSLRHRHLVAPHARVMADDYGKRVEQEVRDGIQVF